MSELDPSGKIAALNRRALQSVVNVLSAMHRLQSMGSAVADLDADPVMAKKAIGVLREYSDACVESYSAVRQYCDHMEPLLEDDE